MKKHWASSWLFTKIIESLFC